MITFSNPAAAAVYAAAITPEAGPDMTVFTAVFDATRADTVPPLPRMTSTSRRYERDASSSTRREMYRARIGCTQALTAAAVPRSYSRYSERISWPAVTYSLGQSAATIRFARRSCSGLR